jgi:hypothetical protein
VPTIKEILQKELGLKKFLRRWVTHFLSPAQKFSRVEASTEMQRILQESGESHFEEIATGDASRFQYSYSYPSSKMSARSPRDVIPRTRQAIGSKKTMVAILFTRRKLIVLDIRPKGSKVNWLSFVD